MLHLEMYVRSIIPDSTASTAKQALHRMGLTSVVDVHRLQRWWFELDDQADWTRAANQLSRVDALVNANKHRATVALVEDPRSAINPPAGARPRSGTVPVWICVEPLDDVRGQSMCGVLQSRLGMSNIRRCAASEFWRLDIETPSLEMARDVARTAMKRLLVNDQFQKGQLLDA